MSYAENASFSNVMVGYAGLNNQMGQTPDNSEVRNRVLLKLAASPFTMGPLIAGITASVGFWALSVWPGVGLFAALAGLLVGGGSFATRLLVSGESVAKDVLAEMRKETSRLREQELDDLDARLTQDGDPRTENALRDLRALATAFRERHTWASGLNSRSTYDIMEGVGQLFNRCVRSLERTLELWHIAETVHTRAAKKPILAQREHLLEEIARSIAELGKIMVEIQNLDSGEESPKGLARIREELDQSLSVARAVDAEMRSWEKEYDVAAPDLARAHEYDVSAGTKQEGRGDV